ncbi:MAG: xanthine dehydrogenase family protein subunit M [Candidatus Cloacimonetes bacterium]|nr:xanthine dehydrogenase family protein subunit M [Candidatus Cloacimonadota bacterium]
MKFVKPKDVENLLKNLEEDKGKKYFLAGGTDLNVQIKNGIIRDANIIYINHLSELSGISEENNIILIGATTSITDILDSDLIKRHLPYFQRSLESFASPLLQNTATIGGNIANGSPTADVIPLLLVLNAKVELSSKSQCRLVYIKDFFTGYKQNVMKSNEIITHIIIDKNAEKDFQTFYEKVGARRTLTISKVTLAGMKKVSGNRISQIRLAVGSLSEFPRRLFKVEDYITDKTLTEIDFSKVENLLGKEITPITDLRSDKEYRYHVCVNLIRTFLNQ